MGYFTLYMASDTVVFDIETQNFFTDPDVGWNNFAGLKISVVCAYSYEKDDYFCADEDHLEDLIPLFANAKKIVGFSMNRYDVPVLNLYFKKYPEGKGEDSPIDLWRKERVDLLDEIELTTGRRISLDLLSQANLGAGKTGKGHEAIDMYREGRIDELKAYCKMDVELTKRLYDQFVNERYFLIPDRKSGETRKVEFAKAASPKQSEAPRPAPLF